MTQKMLCLCATAALLFVFATTYVASAQETVLPEPSTPVACPCEFASSACPCKWGCYNRGCAPVASYRVGLFGCIRPVVYAPVYRPVPVRFVAPPCSAVYAPSCAPVCVAPRFIAPCPTYVIPARPTFCW